MVTKVVIICLKIGGNIEVYPNGWMDDCDFASFSTVFPSYQDDETLIMKGCVQ